MTRNLSLPSNALPTFHGGAGPHCASWATTRVAPTPLTPHSYDLTPTTSLLTPQSAPYNLVRANSAYRIAQFDNTFVGEIMKAPFTHIVTALLTGLLAGLLAVAITACGGGGGGDTGSVTAPPVDITPGPAAKAPSITTQPVKIIRRSRQNRYFLRSCNGQRNARLPVEEKRHRHQRCHLQHLRHTCHHLGRQRGLFGSR